MKKTIVLASLVGLLGWPSAGLAVPCFPLPEPTAAIAVVDPTHQAPTLLDTGGTINYRMVFSGNGTGATLPLTWEVFLKDEGDVTVGTRVDTGTVNIPISGAAVTINNSFSARPGMDWMYLVLRVTTANPLCGNADQRAQLPVATSGTGVIAKSYRGPKEPEYVHYMMCAHPNWYNSGGTCIVNGVDLTGTADCWFHAQRTACLLSQDDEAMWGQLNCDLRPGMSIWPTIAVGPCRSKLYQAPPSD